MKESFVFLAEGFEEVEALTPVDVLRRAGMAVKTVSITSSLQVKGAHGVTVTADVLFDSTRFKDAEWLIFPGGMPGASNLYGFSPLHGLIENQFASRTGRIAAICASPGILLGQLGILKGRTATCYPGFEKYMKGAEYVDRRVVWDNKFVLGNGPSSALKWALRIVTQSIGEDKMFKIANDMLLYPMGEDNVDNFFG